MIITDLDSPDIIITDTILLGSAFSSGVDFRGCAPFGWIGPTGWTAATAALQVSIDGVTWFVVTNSVGTFQALSNAPVNTFALLSGSIANNLPGLSIPRRTRIWSETAGADVPQLADRTFTWFCRPIVGRKP